MYKHRLTILIGAVAFAAVAGTTTAPAASETAGRTYALGHGAQVVNLRLRAGHVPPGFIGGEIVAGTGETVEVYADEELLYGEDFIDGEEPYGDEEPLDGEDLLDGEQDFLQHWADFLASLPHGKELDSVGVFLASLDGVEEYCGEGALGCYDSEEETIVALGEDLRSVTAASVLMHEYGHHVANNRDNAPWDAVDWGTKRWASYVDVCRRAADGELAPGDEDEDYELNPGEAWAETYRLLAERKAGLPESDWDVVDEDFYPDDTAVKLLERDVLDPWKQNTITTLTGSFAEGAGRSSSHRVSTEYDGVFRAKLTAPAGTVFELRVVDPETGEVLARSRGARSVKTVRVEVCGQRSLRVRVVRSAGSGSYSYSLAISKP